MHKRAATLLYRVIQTVREEPVVPALNELERTQWLSPQELRTFQLKKLKHVCVAAYERSEFYQNRFDDAGFDPYAMESLEDLRDVPLLSKEEIIQNTSTIVDASYRGKVMKESTSGSTGTPLSLTLPRHATSRFRAAMYREHRWFNLDVGEREFRFYGIPLDRGSYWKERFKDWCMNRRRAVVYNLSDADLEEHWKTLCRFKPDYLYGYASSVYRFSEYLKRKGYAPQPFVKAIITTSEVLHPYERELMESFWRIPVVNEYGSSETGILAHQCPEGGMHVCAENNFVELIKDGRPAEPGESGEVVITNLDNDVMPLIRYRINDVAAMSTESCSCGRALPLIEVVEGRLNSMVVTPEGKVSCGIVFYYIARSLLEQRGEQLQFLIVQKELDHLHFIIKEDSQYSEEGVELVKQRVYEELGPTMRVTSELVDELPRLASGKLMHFLSELDIDVAGTQYSVGADHRSNAI